MFLSVKERARQIASGQFQPSQAAVEPPPPVVASKVVPAKVVTAKFSPSKGPGGSSKTAPSPSTPKKESPKASISKAPKTPSTPTSPKPSSVPSWKATAPKTPSSKTPSSKETKEKSSKSSSARASSPKASSSKSSSSKSSSSKRSSSPKTSPKIAAPAPPKPKLTRSKTSPPDLGIGIGSFADDPPEDHTTISGLKAACLKQASGVTGLGGRRLAVNLKQTSSGEWYAALKDLSSDKYLKMWMDRSKTYETQIEALEAYLVFAKKMKQGCRLFPPMSPKAASTKSK
ncbi:hypothetical protein N0V83_009932 [Neocucurbitaria cava]|uniref:Uncharacterized protein n=1 Tax=Neocucurbitaria cava TaxID=798079 RepID=A0A9W8Y1T8_9PLEO|nr:hypothetical protein N0V83_009932 [Neocucurbitaria cava]